MRLLREKCSLKRLVGELPDIRFLASPSSCDIENSHAVFRDELLKQQRRAFIARRPLRQVNPGFPVLLSKFRCAFAQTNRYIQLGAVRTVWPPETIFLIIRLELSPSFQLLELTGVDAAIEFIRVRIASVSVAKFSLE